MHVVSSKIYISTVLYDISYPRKYSFSYLIFSHKLIEYKVPLKVLAQKSVGLFISLSSVHFILHSFLSKQDGSSA